MSDTMVVVLGYVALDENGKPYRPSRSGYAWQKGLTNPPRLYSTENRAKTYSPVGKAAAVVLQTQGETNE